MSSFVIRSKSETDDEGAPLYWSNEDGWVLLSQATEFTQRERDALNLPIDGTWQFVGEEGAIEYDLVVSVDGVFKLSPFDLVEETVEAAGEALRLKQAHPGSVVSLVVVERS